MINPIQILNMMAVQSKWVVKENSKNQIIRASTIKPRMDYASDLVDKVLDTLAQKKLELDKTNVKDYRKMIEDVEPGRSFLNSILYERDVSYAIESLRQVRRSLDSVIGLGNLPAMLAPSVSIVRITRSQILSVMPTLDLELGDVSLLLNGIIIDAAHLASLNLDFGMANKESQRLLDEAKLIADSKLCKQFPNLDFL